MARLATVNAFTPLLMVMAAATPPHAAPAPPAFQEQILKDFACSPTLARMFAPSVVSGESRTTYEVCVSDRALADVIPSGWSADALTAADVFTAADPHVKRAVGHLYAGHRTQVARGWVARPGALDSLTLISPRPDLSLTRLVSGTLLIRVVTDR